MWGHRRGAGIGPWGSKRRSRASAALAIRKGTGRNHLRPVETSGAASPLQIPKNATTPPVGGRQPDPTGEVAAMQDGGTDRTRGEISAETGLHRWHQISGGGVFVLTLSSQVKRRNGVKRGSGTETSSAPLKT